MEDNRPSTSATNRAPSCSRPSTSKSRKRTLSPWAERNPTVSEPSKMILDPSVEYYKKLDAQKLPDNFYDNYPDKKEWNRSQPKPPILIGVATRHIDCYLNKEDPLYAHLEAKRLKENQQQIKEQQKKCQAKLNEKMEAQRRKEYEQLTKEQQKKCQSKSPEEIEAQKRKENEQKTKTQQKKSGAKSSEKKETQKRKENKQQTKEQQNKSQAKSPEKKK